MVKAMMMSEIQSFIILYLVSLAGVSIGLRGLFHFMGLMDMIPMRKTVLTIFSITLSVFDFFASFTISM
jgi:hypothetical protein